MTTTQIRQGERFALAAVALFGVVACLLGFLAEAHVGFNLWDEGFLWYGVQRVLHGEVPVRDFMSYDPGRYYWVAGLLWLFHVHGIIAVRAATAAFAAVGVIGAGLLVLRGSTGRIVARVALCVFAMVLCLLWMLPWWKGYDAAMSVILTASLARVLAYPSARRLLVHGIVVGLAAVLGRNHGLYGVIACLLATPVLMLCADKPVWHRCIRAWLAGVVLGFAPILLGLILNHRFAVMFWDSIRFMLFEYKGTNLPLPVPWPWTVAVAQQPLSALIRPWLVGCFFVALPLFCVSGAALVLRRTRHDRIIANPVFAASVLTAVPYLNVAFSRADVGHLAQAILPCLVGFLVLPWPKQARVVVQWLGCSVLAFATLWVVLPLHAGYVMRTQPGWVSVDVRGDRLWMSADTAVTVKDIDELASRYVHAGGTILSVPVWPGAYALLGVRSPVYETYPLLPRNDAFQDQEIARLRQAVPQLVLANDVAVDGRDDLRYANTHPRIWRYISTHYHRIGSPVGEPQLEVYLPDAEK
ncbi:hypothetical protein ABQJ54_06445 [Rhodanobacter sp. Si-c]|uniref:Glycosyltransferase RgtA/B/C/D-like domain-containing protein n=1 Tax=Rhodanobacter lycopersici TaxID=3162487 RepID=A0ABV3QDL9_9GAMM